MLNIHGMHSARWGPCLVVEEIGNGPRPVAAAAADRARRSLTPRPPAPRISTHPSLLSQNFWIRTFLLLLLLWICLHIYIYYTYINLYKYVYTWNIFYQIINYAQKESIFQKEELTMSSIKLLKSLVQMIFSLRCSTQTGIASRHISKEKNSRMCDEDGFSHTKSLIFS